MTVSQSIYLALIALGAGAFGGMFGVGGGLILVPLMTGWLGVPLSHAIPASLAGIIATSAASSLVYLKKGLTDTELASKLLLPSVFGALVGVVISTIMLSSDGGKRGVAVVFTVVILVSAFLMFRRKAVDDDDGRRNPAVPATATLATFGGGILSTLLGVGGGIVNVPVISLIVHAPTRVAIATSAYMIGVTAASGAAVYMAVGQMDVAVAAPTVVGLFAGAQIGARLGTKMSGPILRYAFCGLLLYSAFTMSQKVLHG